MFFRVTVSPTSDATSLTMRRFSPVPASMFNASTMPSSVPFMSVRAANVVASPLTPVTLKA